MSLSRKEIEKVSHLARLQLSDPELDAMTAQLANVVEYMETLSGLNTDDVEPLAHASDISNVLADDTLKPSLSREEALANAPKRDDECYRVPAVLGD